jgi:hypothetical protein
MKEMMEGKVIVDKPETKKKGRKPKAVVSFSKQKKPAKGKLKMK